MGLTKHAMPSQNAIGLIHPSASKEGGFMCVKIYRKFYLEYLLQ